MEPVSAFRASLIRFDCDLLLNGVSLDTQGPNAPDSTRHHKLFLGPKVDFKVLNQSSLVRLNHLTWHSLCVLLFLIGILLALDELSVAMGERHFLLRSDLLRFCLLVASDVELGILGLDQLL